MATIKEEHHNILNTKIGILGFGAVGSIVAHELQKTTSNDLFFFSRTPKTRLKLLVEHVSIDLPIQINTTPNSTHKLDWLIICLKEHQYQNAKPWFASLISSRTSVVVIRNGLHHKAPLLEFTASKNILECLIDCPIQLTNNHYYQCFRRPKFTLPKGVLSTEFQSLFHTSIQINQVIDFKTECWKKLCESATLGGILCLHNDTCRIFKNDIIQLQYKHLLEECIKVARADGAHIENDYLENMMEKTMNYPKEKGSSMLNDMWQGKEIELGAKNGLISTIGKTYTIKTPLNDSVITMLQ